MMNQTLTSDNERQIETASAPSVLQQMTRAGTEVSGFDDAKWTGKTLSIAAALVVGIGALGGAALFLTTSMPTSSIAAEKPSAAR